MPKLVRMPLTTIETPAVELLARARTKMRRLYVALAAVVALNLACLSGALTFWAFALRS